jgi:glycosyltransferase involved in cell wall biosynthesis
MSPVASEPAAPAAGPRRSTPRLKVLVLIDSVSRVGGAERLALEQSTRLDRERFDVILCATRSATASAAAAARAAGVRVLSLERRRTLSPLAWLRLWRLLRREGVHVLHAHKFGSNVWGALVGRAARVPVVVAHEHSWAFEGDRVRRALDRHVVGRLADAVVAVSRQDAVRMVEVEGMPKGRVRLIPNGIAPLPESRRDVRKELGIPATAPVVGAVTLLRPEKAIEVLVEATAKLRSFPDVRLLIAGEGPSRPTLESLAADLGLAERALLLGERDDVPDVLRALDVTVICSDFEGTPLALLEYMAAGKAIVATRTGGIPDIIEDGVHGVLVPPRDAAATAAAIERLLADPEERARLGANARERRRREFDLETTIARIAALYEELLAR